MKDFKGNLIALLIFIAILLVITAIWVMLFNLGWSYYWPWFSVFLFIFAIAVALY